MIVVDIETSGLNLEKCGVWQIGALELENPENTFLEEGRIDEEDFIESEALKIIGKTEEELRDKNKKSQKQLIENFFKWCAGINNRLFICQNPQFDHAFLENKSRKYCLNFPTNHRVFDLHSISHFKSFQLTNNFNFKSGVSDFGLKKTLGFVGMEDPRNKHNALEDAKLTAEAFYRIVYGKNLLKEYSRFKIPENLKL